MLFKRARNTTHRSIAMIIISVSIYKCVCTYKYVQMCIFCVRCSFLQKGAEYDASKHRYDHHQRQFTTTFDDQHTVTKLSSAGLVSNTLQHTANRCNSLQHTATHHDTLQCAAAHYNHVLQHTPHIETHSTAHRDKALERWSCEQHTAACCNTLQYAAARCSTLQRAAAHCNHTLQHTPHIATHSTISTP